MVYAVPDEEMYDLSCEELGTCDDSCSPPARGDCLAETSEPAPPAETLPHTGGDPLLGLTALASVVVGVLMVRMRVLR